MASYMSYVNDVANDIADYIYENFDFDTIEDEYFLRQEIRLHEDDMQNSVTGNYDGSYFCNSYKASKYIGSAVFDRDLISRMSVLGDMNNIFKDPETFDVVARISVFYEALEKAIDMIIDDKEL